jgi:predicted DNA-binding protein
MKKDSVSSLISGLVNKAETPEAILNKNVRFSISLTTFQSKRLDILTTKIEISKQEFISKVIEASMLELESQLKLIDMESTDIMGLKSHSYKAGYMREVIESMGMTEEEWWDLMEKNN